MESFSKQKKKETYLKRNLPHASTSSTCNVSDESDESDSKPETKKSRNTKRHSRNFKFRLEWLEADEFKPWLAKSEKPLCRGSGVLEYAYCKLCQIDVFPHKNDIFRHSQSKKHLFRSKQASKTADIRTMLITPIDTKVRYAEIKICGLLATNDVPFKLMDEMSTLYSEIFSDSEIAKKIKLKRSKATALVKNVLGYNFKEDLINKLKTNFFSLIMDESTDISTTKQCALVVIYNENDKVITRFFDMIEVTKGDAQTLHDVLVESLREKNIPLTNLVGLSTDTTNVMVGNHKSLFSLVQKDLPDIALIRCSCHMIHLASAKACLQLPRSIEDVLRNIGAHFSRSSLRQEKFKEFQQFFKTDLHKILLPSNTRWLSVEQCTKRILDQYDPLQSYFRLVSFEDPSKTTEEIVTTLENRFTKVYFEFMVYVLGLVNDFNTMFQSETPLLHKLKPEVEKLLITLCSNYIKPTEIKKTNVFNIEFSNPHHFITLDKLYLGVVAHESLHTIKTDGICSSLEIERFQISCLNFYKILVQEIRSRFTFTDPLYNVIEVVEPTKAQSNSIESLAFVVQRFPFLNNLIDLQKLDNEWRAHSMMNYELHGLQLDSAIEAASYWSKVFNLKNAAGSCLFPNLKIIINLLLILPFSNASVERIFSKLNNIKTDQRNHLKTDTVCALLYTKEGIQLEGGCSKFKPSEKMLKTPVWTK